MTDVITSTDWIPLSDPDRLAEVTNGAVSQDLYLPVGADEDRVFLHGPRLVRLAHIAGHNLSIWLSEMMIDVQTTLM